VVFALSSKYSVALYELITARINLKHVWHEDFSVEDLRALLGVPNKKLERIHTPKPLLTFACAND
jgi:hypothetical protein